MAKDKTIYTIGYGNDPPEAFLQRLVDAGIELVVDVRRRGSKARLGCYAPSEYTNMGIASLLDEHAIGYKWALSLGNWFRVTKSRTLEDSLDAYDAWLQMELKKKKMQHVFFSIMWEINQYHRQTAFLCCEKKAMKAGHWNCHRGIAAEKIADALGYSGDEWSVEHL